MATKKRRSAKQKANDKRLGRMAKKRSSSKRSTRSTPKRTRKTTNKRKKTRKRTNVAKKRRNGSRAKSGVKGFFRGSSLVGKLAMGIGAGTIAGVALNAIAPQFAGVGKLGVAFLAGGPIGGIGQLLLGGGLDGGGLGMLGGLIPQQRTEGASPASLTV